MSQSSLVSTTVSSLLSSQSYKIYHYSLYHSQIWSLSFYLHCLLPFSVHPNDAHPKLYWACASRISKVFGYNTSVSTRESCTVLRLNLFTWASTEYLLIHALLFLEKALKYQVLMILLDSITLPASTSSNANFQPYLNCFQNSLQHSVDKP